MARRDNTALPTILSSTGKHYHWPKSKLAEAEIKLEQMRKYLADQQQRINVLDDLIERGEKEREKLQDSIEQKEMDEFSTRKYR